MAERDAPIAFLHKAGAALQRNIKALAGKRDRAVDMVFKIRSLYEQTLSRVVCLRAVEMSKLGEKIRTLTGKVEAKSVVLQAMLSLVDETTTLRAEVVKLRDVDTECEANVAISSGLQKEILVLKEAVSEILPAAKKADDL